MGMFDSVIAKCPHGCGRDVELQSKAGEQLLNNYPIDNIPDIQVVDDLDGHLASWNTECPRCIGRYIFEKTSERSGRLVPLSGVLLEELKAVEKSREITIEKMKVKLKEALDEIKKKL